MQLQYSQAESMHATGVHDSFKWHLSWAKNKNPSAIGARRGRLACSDSTYVLDSKLTASNSARAAKLKL